MAGIAKPVDLLEAVVEYLRPEAGSAGQRQQEDETEPVCVVCCFHKKLFLGDVWSPLGDAAKLSCKTGGRQAREVDTR